MRRIQRVLVFPCEGEIGLELYRSIQRNPQFRLFGCSAGEVRGSFYENHLGALPGLEDGEFLPALTRILRKHRIDFLFPGDNDSVVQLAEWAADGLVEADVIAPGPDVCRLCRSKGATYAFFAGKLPVPRQLRLEELGEADYPVVVKPDAGPGTGERLPAATRAEAEEMLRRSPLDVVLEYLPGTEYTVDCFTDGTGALLFVSGRERERVADNASATTRLARNSLFRQYAETINIEIKLRGPWFFQLKEDRFGKLRLTEVRPRIGHGSGLQRALGVNLPEMALYDRMGVEVCTLENDIAGAAMERMPTNHFRLDLQYDTVYMDLDDTILMESAVNVDAVRFIFQCRNRGIRVVLVARGLRHPGETLRRHRLDGLFDEVAWIRGNEGKSTVITSPRAILIDNSYAERHEVRQNLGIPVFDPSSLEALMEA